MKLQYILLCCLYFAKTRANAENCDFDTLIKTYFCRNIINVFPSLYYDSDYRLQCDHCSLRVLSHKTMPYENKLTSFNISESGVEYISKMAFTNFKNIQYIFLQNNKIQNMSSSAFSGLKHVYELHLENNRLSELSPKVFSQFQVNWINLSNNRLFEIRDKAFEEVMGLLTLELSHNRINQLHPDSFYGLGSVEFLDLQHNKLCHIPVGTLKHLRGLRYLNLANNKFTTFATGVFSGPRYLEYLNLANNSLSEFEGKILLPLQRLDKLDISGNGIYYLDSNTINSNSPSLRTLFINDNLFSCTHLSNIMRYFKSSSVGIEIYNDNGRFDVQNIAGIACIDEDVRQKIPLGDFLKIAADDTSKYYKSCSLL